jgi:hypothetical protein
MTACLVTCWYNPRPHLLDDECVNVTDAPERLGPNDCLPCGTESARRHHVAKAEHCDVCGTVGRRIYLKPLRDAA